MNTTLNTLGSSYISDRDREDLDFYQTPSYATKTLIEHFDFKSKFIWEPMAGNGMIAKELTATSYNVYSTDIVERDFKLNAVLDYFTASSPLPLVGGDFAVVTNPPYNVANEFLKHTLEVVQPKTCCVFLPTRYLEGISRYEQIYSKHKPSKILAYVRRIGCFTLKDIANGKKITDHGVGSAVSYMWLCFDRDSYNNQDTKTELEWVP